MIYFISEINMQQILCPKNVYFSLGIDCHRSKTTNQTKRLIWQEDRSTLGLLEIHSPSQSTRGNFIESCRRTKLKVKLVIGLKIMRIYNEHIILNLSVKNYKV